MLSDFIRGNIRSSRRKDSYEDPDLASCLRVKRVAAVSIASQAGIAAGDLLISVDGLLAGDLRPDFMCQPSQGRVMLFQRPGESEQTEVETTGVDIGADLEATPQGVASRYRPGKGDPELLGILWEAGDWKTLERLAAADMKGSEGDPRLRNFPSLVFLGAALCEQGRASEGMALIGEYMENFGRDWTMNFTAVGHYYLAQGQLPAALTSFQHHPYERTARLIEKLGGQRPARETLLQGRPFPSAYSLRRLEGSAEGSLPQALNGLQPHQLLVVCLLASYRGNGPITTS